MDTNAPYRIIWIELLWVVTMSICSSDRHVPICHPSLLPIDTLVHHWSSWWVNGDRLCALRAWSGVAWVTKTTVLFYLTPIWATLFAYILLSEWFGFGLGGLQLLVGSPMFIGYAG